MKEIEISQVDVGFGPTTRRVFEHGGNTLVFIDLPIARPDETTTHYPFRFGKVGRAMEEGLRRTEEVTSELFEACWAKVAGP